MSAFRLDFDALPWTTMAPGARQKVIERGRQRLRLVEFDREFVEADWCRKAHAGYVVTGLLELEFDGHIVTFGPGDGLHIPGGETSRHKARSVDGNVRLFLIEES